MNGSVTAALAERYVQQEAGSPYTEAMAQLALDLGHNRTVLVAYLFGVTPTTEGELKFFTLKKEVKDGRVKSAGEWNTMEMTAQGESVTLWVNGAVTCRFNNCGKLRGHVGLEGEGYRVEFRNLKVKNLPEVSKDSTEP